MNQSNAIATCSECNYNFPAVKVQNIKHCPNCSTPAISANDDAKPSEPKLRIIGLAGKARTGKSTVADQLKKLLPNTEYYSFAKPLKTAISSLFHVPLSVLETDEKDQIMPEFGFSLRHAMQTLGTEWGREMLHPDIWVKVAKSQLDPSMLWIISDVRYENEAAFIRENGVLIHLYRDDAPQVKAHSSENGVSVYPGDFWIYNNGSLEDLDQSVAELVPQITQILAAQEDAYA
ncbi:deoxynucleotide monophosphate kinase [Pseudomonas sp. F1_0610]|uniref:deoxynucleotide monophosphate kinase family protein n=1 Tax=Pseudomonas sp. F1_0610 TaxID=3114284 RepID=UPI0039C3E344